MLEAPGAGLVHSLHILSLVSSRSLLPPEME